jgi:hypothetical protein
LDEYLAQEDARERQREEVQRLYAERQAQPRLERQQQPPASEVALRFATAPGWIWPVGNNRQFVRTDLARRLEPIDAEVAREEERSVTRDDEQPDYHRYTWFEDVDEQRAREDAWGIPAGSLTAEAPEERKRRESAETQALLASWKGTIEDRRAAGDSRFAADDVRHCANPNCQEALTGRGAYCQACYKYRRRNGGQDRPVSLANRARRRAQGF